MADTIEIIAKKFSELVVLSEQGKVEDFTPGEQAIWLLVTIRCDMDIASLEWVFERTLTRSEIQESIAHLHTMQLHDLATAFAQALVLYDSENIYGVDGYPARRLSSAGRAKLDLIEAQIGRHLWGIDERLYQLVQEENKP